MFIFRGGKRMVLQLYISLLYAVTVFSQKSFLSLSALNDSARSLSAQQYLKKMHLVSNASAYVTETRNQFLPAIRFDDQVNIGTG